MNQDAPPSEIEGEPTYKLPDKDELYLSVGSFFKLTKHLREEVQRLKRKIPVDLVAFTGRAGSGKNLAASFLLDRVNWRNIAFADTLKEMASIVIMQTDGLSMRRDMGYLSVRDAIESRKEEVIPSIGKSPREIFQTLGTEWGRDMIHENLWVTCLEGRINRAKVDYPERKFAITDLRFPNEEKYVRENNGIIIRIIREDAPEVSAHKSEEQEIKADHIINNNGTPEQLREQLFDILNIK